MATVSTKQITHWVKDQNCRSITTVAESLDIPSRDVSWLPLKVDHRPTESHIKLRQHFVLSETQSENLSCQIRRTNKAQCILFFFLIPRSLTLICKAMPNYLTINALSISCRPFLQYNDPDTALSVNKLVYFMRKCGSKGHWHISWLGWLINLYWQL